MLDHLSIQVADLEASAAFYDAVLAELGGERVLETDDAIGYGIPPAPRFWIGVHDSGTGFRESHIAFQAADRQAVDRFFAAATKISAELLHAPKEWLIYHQDYYGAFVRDPDGNNVEAVCRLPAD